MQFAPPWVYPRASYSRESSHQIRCPSNQCLFNQNQTSHIHLRSAQTHHYPQFTLTNLSTNRLQLLNTTVQSLAVAVNAALTATYHAAYSDAPEEDELVLLTAPLSSTMEVQSLYTSGIIDIESALPTALHSLGLNASAIDGALKRRRDTENTRESTFAEADCAFKVAQTKKLEAETAKVALRPPSFGGRARGRAGAAQTG